MAIRPASKRAAERRYRLRQFGLTEAEYEAMLEQQGHACAICGEPDARGELAIDHDHETNRFRGLLCRACNSGYRAARRAG